MFKLNLKIALRNLWKNKVYTLINLTGLAIGMASCILIFIFIRYQLTFDNGFKNEGRIYRFVTNWKYGSTQNYSQGVPVPLAPAVRNEFAGIAKVAAIAKKGGIVLIKDEHGNQIIKSQENVYYTEPEFFDIFDVTWNIGEAKRALTAPNTVALSETTARRFFGTADKAIGKTILFNNKINLRVTGVFKDMPQNSSFPLNIVISYQTYNWKKFVNWDAVSSQMECYVLLKRGIHIDDLKKPLLHFNKTHYQGKGIAGDQTNSFQALDDIHFSDRYGNFADDFISKEQIYGLAVIGLFLLLTACINFVNLATAQAINRSKEVGIRKLLGSRRKQLIVQFLTETLAVSIMALLIACVLTELALPVMKDLFNGQASFSLFGHPIIFAFMTVLVILVGFMAGFYPAMIISGFSPVLAIKNKIAISAYGLSLRKILMVVQFTVTIVLIISTMVILMQMKYLREKSLGFNAEAVTMVNLPGDSLSRNRYNNFKERSLQIPGVQMLSFCQTAPLSEDISPSAFNYNGRRINDFEIRTSKADEDYFKLFDLKIIAGKIFLKSDTISGCVVNETFLRRLGITNPQDAVGKMLNATNEYGYDVPIVGVVKDFNDKTLRESISPMAIYPQKTGYLKTAIKIESKNLMSTMKKIENLWNEDFPNAVFTASFVKDDITSYYKGEQIMGVLFRVFAGVIIFISFIGLLGLISFVTTQRTKEVAIRKVLGASTIELIKMLNGSFILMVFLANVLAWPLAYLFVSKWLAGFAYRIELNILPFAVAMISSMLIAFLTVSLHSYHTANSNPADALKYE